MVRTMNILLSLHFYYTLSRLKVKQGAESLQRNPGCGSQRLLRPLVRASHPAGRGPNSSSLFPPLAAVVAVAPKGRGFCARSSLIS